MWGCTFHIQGNSFTNSAAKIFNIFEDNKIFWNVSTNLKADVKNMVSKAFCNFVNTNLKVGF